MIRESKKLPLLADYGMEPDQELLVWELINWKTKVPFPA